jgi:hypothetical protein
VSDTFPFDDTDYYGPEMGDGLRRRFLCFAGGFDPADLADAKLRTNEVEAELAVERDGRTARRVNLDPGYVTGAKLVLASAKDAGHRVYLRDGIHAEVTLAFRRASCARFPWTYPDFRSGRYDAFLLKVRESLDSPARAAPVN